MKNFTLDSFYSSKLRQLSDRTDLSEIELVERMFQLVELQFKIKQNKDKKSRS